MNTLFSTVIHKNIALDFSAKFQDGYNRCQRYYGRGENCITDQAVDKRGLSSFKLSKHYEVKMVGYQLLFDSE